MKLKMLIRRKYLPITITVSLFIATYLLAALKYPGLLTPQVLFYLLIDNSFILISAIGMTFVILTGGIDLSVGPMIAFTAMISAWLVEVLYISPLATIPIVLLVGILFGAIIGSMIQFFNVPPFIATLAGFFFARGMCFIISVDAIRINHPFYKAASSFQIRLPGNSFVSISVVVALLVVVLGIYLAHYTNFGRTVYAIGGNESSATLMGLPVPRVKVLVYTFNGFCSALAGVVYSIYMLSAHGWYAQGMELDVIASVVIGGTPLTGGVGYVFGTLFGVLIQGLIQTIIIFDGNLNTWWTKIVIGLLTLVFILLQRLLSTRGRTQVISSARKAPADSASPAAAD